MNVAQNKKLDKDALLTETNYAVLSFDHIILLVPQTQFIGAQSLEGLQATTSAYPKALGRLSVVVENNPPQNWPVYCFDNELRVALDPPASREQCALLHADDHQFGLLCDQINHVDYNDLLLRPIPLCMRTPALLFEGLAIYNEKIAYVVSAAKLHAKLA